MVISRCGFAIDGYELYKYTMHIHGSCPVYFNLLFGDVLVDTAVEPCMIRNKNGKSQAVRFKMR